MFFQQYKPMFRYQPREVRWPWPDAERAALAVERNSYRRVLEEIASGRASQETAQSLARMALDATRRGEAGGAS